MKNLRAFYIVRMRRQLKILWLNYDSTLGNENAFQNRPKMLPALPVDGGASPNSGLLSKLYDNCRTIATVATQMSRGIENNVYGLADPEREHLPIRGKLYSSLVSVNNFTNYHIISFTFIEITSNFTKALLCKKKLNGLKKLIQCKML